MAFNLRSAVFLGCARVCYSINALHEEEGGVWFGALIQETNRFSAYRNIGGAVDL